MSMCEKKEEAATTVNESSLNQPDDSYWAEKRQEHKISQIKAVHFSSDIIVSILSLWSFIIIYLYVIYSNHSAVAH